MKKTWAWTLPLLGCASLFQASAEAQGPTRPPVPMARRQTPAPQPLEAVDNAVGPIGPDAAPAEAAPGMLPVDQPMQLQPPPSAGPMGGPSQGYDPNAACAPGCEPQAGCAPGPTEAGYAPGGYMPGEEEGYDSGMSGANHRATALAGIKGLGAVLGYGVIPYLAPVTEGGYCQMRYYDVYADAMWLRRADSGTAGVLARFDGPAGDVALGNRAISPDSTAGLRLNMNVQVGAGRTLEFHYYGLFWMEGTHTVTSQTNNLFTGVGGFGDYALGLGEGGANQVTARTALRLDNFEFNNRWRWVGADCRWQGSALVGVRYLGIGDQFNLRTNVPGNDPFIFQNFDNGTRAFTANIGPQFGGDLWMNFYPGIRGGFEAKFALTGVRGSINNNYISTLTDNGDVQNDTVFSERLKLSRLGTVIDLGSFMTYRISEQLTLRGGYNLLFVSAVTNALDNFNDTPPTSIAGVPARGVIRPRIRRTNPDLFHGASFGVEYMW